MCDSDLYTFFMLPWTRQGGGGDVGVLGIAHLLAGRAEQLVNGVMSVFLRPCNGHVKCSSSLLICEGLSHKYKEISHEGKPLIGERQGKVKMPSDTRLSAVGKPRPIT